MTKYVLSWAIFIFTLVGVPLSAVQSSQSIAGSNLLKVLGLESSKVASLSCDEISDKFCEKLWNKENRGTWVFENNQSLQLGDLRSGVISWAEYYYLQKWIKFKCQLPDALKKVLTPRCGRQIFISGPVERIASHLKKLNKVPKQYLAQQSWREELDIYKHELKNALERAGNILATQKYPHLLEHRFVEFSLADKEVVFRSKLEIYKQVLDLFYLESSEWKNILSLFDEAKRLVSLVLDGLQISDELRAKLQQRINDIEISLPYRDPLLAGAYRDCWEDENNGFYSWDLNKFVICAGKINTLKSNGGLLGVILHEIAHAIDPDSIGLLNFRESEVQKQTSRAYKMNGRIDCGEWEKIVDSVFETKVKLKEFPSTIYNLYSCLVDLSELEDMDLGDAFDYAGYISANSIEYRAENMDFSWLLVEKYFGVEERVNPYYLNPRAVSRYSNQYQVDESYESMGFSYAAIFTQSYICFSQSADKEPLDSEELFKKSVEEVEYLLKSYLVQKYSYVQRATREFKNYDMAKEVGEDFSDWVMQKAFEIRLEEESSLDEKYSLVLGQHATFCQKGMYSVEQQRLQDVEHSFGDEPHPVDRKRRLRFFNEFISKQLSCQPGEDALRYGANCGEKEYIRPQSLKLQ